MHTRQLTGEDLPALTRLLMREPAYNVFHLSALIEVGLSPQTEAAGPVSGLWAVGVFDGEALVGALLALRGTGGTWYGGDAAVARALADAVVQKVSSGVLSLLSGHQSQLKGILPLIKDAGVGPVDECHFSSLTARDFLMPSATGRFSPPRRAGEADTERLIDFYLTGFYSLARLPTRAAWRTRLSEQLAYRTLYLVEDPNGRVISAALSSAEAGGVAMLGGVATLEEHRGEGLSTLCVGALCRDLFSRSIEQITLFYLKDNHSAARVYNKLGFCLAGDWLLAPLGVGTWFGPFFR